MLPPESYITRSVSNDHSCDGDAGDSQCRVESVGEFSAQKSRGGGTGVEGQKEGERVCVAVLLH